MNFRQIEIFREIMRTGSITAAAQNLLISQPAVSKQLGLLERTLNLRLFERIRGRLRPTVEAQVLFEHAERMFDTMDNVTRLARDLATARYGEVVIAAMPAVSGAWLPHIIEKVVRDRPDVKITLLTRSSEKILEWVESGQVDLGIAALSRPNSMATVERLFAFKSVCAMPAGHRLARRRAVSDTDIVGERLISVAPLDVPTAARPNSNLHGTTSGVPPIVVELSSIACQLVARGLGIAIVDELTANHMRDERIAVRPYTPQINSDIFLLRSTLRRASNIVEGVVEAIKTNPPKEWT